MSRTVVASLSLNDTEAGVLNTALMYYADTIMGDPDDYDEEDIAQTRRDIETAEHMRSRLRKSLERHGYRFKS